jgi:hypothetical protein
LTASAPLLYPKPKVSMSAGFAPAGPVCGNAAGAGTVTLQLRKNGVAIAEAAVQTIFGAGAQQSLNIVALVTIAPADLVAIAGLPATMPSNFAAIEVWATHSAGGNVTPVYSQLAAAKLDG